MTVDAPTHTYKLELDERFRERFLATVYFTSPYTLYADRRIYRTSGFRLLNTRSNYNTIMVSSIAVQAWTVAVLAVLRSRSALGSPHGNLPTDVYATDDAVTRSLGGLSNATTTDRDVRTDHGRHSSFDGMHNPHVFCRLKHGLYHIKHCRSVSILLLCWNE